MVAAPTTNTRTQKPRTLTRRLSGHTIIIMVLCGQEKREESACVDDVVVVVPYSKYTGKLRCSFRATTEPTDRHPPEIGHPPATDTRVHIPHVEYIVEYKRFEENNKRTMCQRAPPHGKCRRRIISRLWFGEWGCFSSGLNGLAMRGRRKGGVVCFDGCSCALCTPPAERSYNAYIEWVYMFACVLGERVCNHKETVDNQRTRHAFTPPDLPFPPPPKPSAVRCASPDGKKTCAPR